MKIFSNPIAFLVPVFVFTATAMAAQGGGGAADSIPLVWWIAPISSLLALGFAVYFYKKVMAAPEGTERMIEIARHVREGARHPRSRQAQRHRHQPESDRGDGRPRGVIGPGRPLREIKGGAPPP